MSFPHYSADCRQYHDLVVDFSPTNPATHPGPRPRIVVLCGSTRHGLQDFQHANLLETMAGNIVLSIGCDTKRDDVLFGELSPERQIAVKASLDALHLRKIDLADEVLILNSNGYMGESTARELRYAKDHGKPVRWLSWPYCEECGTMNAAYTHYQWCPLVSKGESA